MDQGSVFKRCGCRDQRSGRLRGAGCARLPGSGHGSWYFSAELPSGGGGRRRVRRGGFESRAAAAAALKALTGLGGGPAAGMSTGQWLERWLASRVSLRASTRHGYAAHVRRYLIPWLGAVPIADLAQADVQGMFTAITSSHHVAGRPVSAATLQRIHATIRAALNAAIRAGLIASNPGRWVELPAAIRPRPQVWTPALTAAWKEHGSRPLVGVWTPAQTAEFLASARDERLYALFHLVALRGLRRGEAAGLRWADLDLQGATLTVSRQLQQLGGRLVTGPPKSQAGQRVIALDRTTVAAVRAHRQRQRDEHAAAGDKWLGSGYVFTSRAGAPVPPDWLTRYFRRLVTASGLPPVTLQGLRHGAATLALAAGTQMKIVQDQLGHSTITLTADTYTCVLPEVARTAAEDAARLLFPPRRHRPPATRAHRCSPRRASGYVRKRRRPAT
jgi:integrase